MGYLYKGDATLKGNLSVLTDKPLDKRSVVQNVTNMLTIDSTYVYNGMPVVNIDEKAIYILLDKTNISKLDSWKRIGTVTINNNEIDLSSFVTSTELSGQLDTLKGEISTDINTKISESKTEILSEVDTKISTSKTEILSEVDTKIDEALENFNPGSGGSGDSGGSGGSGGSTGGSGSSTGGNVDLSNYVTKDELTNYSTSEEIDNTYAKKTDIPTIPNFKTINGQEITGTGDITISGDGSNLTIDDTLTETSSNPVKSSGIYNGVKTMINAKFVVLTEAEYNAMASHDANTFYYIKQ